MPRFFHPSQNPSKKRTRHQLGNQWNKWLVLKQEPPTDQATMTMQFMVPKNLGEIPAGATGEIWDAFPWSFKEMEPENDGAFLKESPFCRGWFSSYHVFHLRGVVLRFSSGRMVGCFSDLVQFANFSKPPVLENNFLLDMKFGLCKQTFLLLR